MPSGPTDIAYAAAHRHLMNQPVAAQGLERKRHVKDIRNGPVIVPGACWVRPPIANRDVAVIAPPTIKSGRRPTISMRQIPTSEASTVVALTDQRPH